MLTFKDFNGVKLKYENFKQNRKLPVGTIASWTVDNMLGTEETGTELVEIVKCMLLLVEQADPVC